MKTEAVIENMHNVTGKEQKDLVKLYADRICQLWDGFMDAIRSLRTVYSNGEITDERYSEMSQWLVGKTREILASMMIEQFYNTGESDIFDRALMINENVRLEPISLINMNEFSGDMTETQFVVFYQGIFLMLDSAAKTEKKPESVKAIIRDEGQVDKINSRLARSREILMIDEVKLGKKYYDGLYMRSHFFR
jgi:hypothetical protein